MLPDIDLRACYNQGYRVFALAAFAAGLIVKVPVLRYVAGVSWLKSGIVSFAAASAWWVLDVVVIGCAALASGLLWNVLLGFRGGGAVWVSLILVAPMIRAGLETLLVRRATSRRIGRKGYCLLYAANSLCIVLAIYVLILVFRAYPPQA